MLLFFRHRAKRRTVMVTLVAWTLALMAGLVNACLLQDAAPGQHGQVYGHPSSGQSIEIHSDSSATPQDAALGMPSEPTGDADAYKETCKKFCDSEAPTAVRLQGHDPADPGHAVVIAGACTPDLAPVAQAKVPFDERPLPQSPSVAIRFLRLTL